MTKGMPPHASAVAHDHAPLFDVLVNYTKSGVYPLHTPAHRGIHPVPGTEQLLTPLGLACDLPAMQPTDSNFHPKGCLAEAQKLAASLWGASRCFFLMNGSTIGAQAMMLAALSSGDKVILSRQVHISTMSGLTLTGARPVYLPSRWLESGGSVPPTVEEVAQCLQQHPDARAVMITHPSYYGIGRPLDAIAELCHEKGIPLLVDEAHGAHLNFLPPEEDHLPSGILAGADAVVQSPHKTLGSLIGTAQLLLSENSLLNPERVQRALNLLQSTSSNYLLLASLDLTRRWMAQEGFDLFRESTRLVSESRARLNQIPGLRTLEVTEHSALVGCKNDPLRLVIDVSGLGLSGYECGKILYEEFKLFDEFCDDRNIVYVLSPIDREEHFRSLEAAFQELSARSENPREPEFARAVCIDMPPMELTPKEAFAQQRKRVPLEEAQGQICGETVTIYPPGIPLICPGEVVTDQTIKQCQKMASQSVVVYAADASLSTITVLDI